jgi:hypothetical protein
MNKIIVAIALYILFPQFAAAQEPRHPPRAIEYGFLGGGTQGLGLNAGLGLEVLTHGFGVGTEFGGTGFAANDSNKTTGIWCLDGVYHYFSPKPRGIVAPFVAGGLTDFFGHNTHTQYGGGGAYHTIGFNVGSGVDILATQHAGVRFDVRYYGHGGRILNWVYPDVQQFSFVAFRIAVTFR